jgi:hypothetical protein
MEVKGKPLQADDTSRAKNGGTFMRNRALLVVVAVGVALVVGMPAAGCTVSRLGPAASTNDEANPPKSNPEIGAFRKIAFKACIDSADDRVAADTAEAYCACAVDELVENLNTDEMVQIGSSGDENLPTYVQMEMTDAIVTCFDISSMGPY